MIKKAERNLEELLDMPVDVLKHYEGDDEESDYVATEPALVKIKQDTSKFVVERLKKDEYAQRQENTGKDGKDLPTPILANITNVPNNDGDPQNKPTQEENQGDTGRDISQQDNLDNPATNSPSPDRQNTDADQHSLGIISALEERSNQGLPSDNGGSQLLSSGEMEQN